MLVLIVIVVMVMMVMATAALLVIVMMVVMTFFYFLKKLLSHIIGRFLDDRKKLLTSQLVDRSCHDRCLRVLLTDRLNALCNLVSVSDIGTA